MRIYKLLSLSLQPLQAKPFFFAATKNRIGRRPCGAAGTAATPAAFLLRIMPPSWHPVPACSPRQCCRRANPILATTTAGGLFFDAATKIGIGRGKCCRHGRCSRNHSSLRQRRIESDAEPRSRHGRCMRAILYRHNDCAASIRKSGLEIKNRCSPRAKSREKLASILKFGPEIKNRCTKEGVNREKLASIPKSGLEIKNRCTKEGVNGENRASIPKSGPEIKNRCTQEGVNGENLQ